MATELGLNIDEVFECPLGPLPYSIASERGSLVKTSKFELMHDLQNLVQPEGTPSTTSHQVIILDAMVLPQTLNVAHNATFEDLAETVLKIIMEHVSANSTASVCIGCAIYTLSYHSRILNEILEWNQLKVALQ